MPSNTRARLIAFYLPQFHPIPENDEWWGKGFTEWTNVAKAKPLFSGHYQPNLPTELGFYDLRVPEVREAQARLAREHGIEAFCYWHYWFGGERLLERPFQEVLDSGKPDFPFCLAWANESWTGVWHGSPSRVLKEQDYPGEADYRRHFEFLLRAFRDPRYFRVSGKPLLVIYRPKNIPDIAGVVRLWRSLAAENGLPGLYLVATATDPKGIYRESGVDAITIAGLIRAPECPHHLVRGRLSAGILKHNRLASAFQRLWPWPFPEHVYRYQDVWPKLVVDWPFDVPLLPSVLPNWDNTPRSGLRGWVLQDPDPELFRLHVRDAMRVIRDQPAEQKILFLKSWNEWAEGNYLEPDRRFGRSFLEVIRDSVCDPLSRLPDHDKKGHSTVPPGRPEICTRLAPEAIRSGSSAME